MSIKTHIERQTAAANWIKESHCSASKQSRLKTRVNQCRRCRELISVSDSGATDYVRRGKDIEGKTHPQLSGDALCVSVLGVDVRRRLRFTLQNTRDQ